MIIYHFLPNFIPKVLLVLSLYKNGMCSTYLCGKCCFLNSIPLDILWTYFFTGGSPLNHFYFSEMIITSPRWYHYNLYGSVFLVIVCNMAGRCNPLVEITFWWLMIHSYYSLDYCCMYKYVLVSWCLPLNRLVRVN